MSILIKGMEMPTDCSRCILRSGVWCIVRTRGKYPVAYESSHHIRNDTCPLVEVPPHGRLIDADAIFDQWYQLNFDSKITDGTLTYLNWQLEDAPTIIEAEGE